MEYQEFFEDYKERVSKYCIAAASLSVRKIDGEFKIESELNEAFDIYAGNFDAHYISSEIAKNEIELSDVDKEGIWFFEVLLRYVRGDENEPSYMETLFVEKTFLSTFEELEEIEKNITQSDINDPF